MTKADLAEAVYRIHGGLSRRESADIVDRILGTLKDAIRSGTIIRIAGFGCLEVVRRRARRGRNPQTGERIVIAPRARLIFRPSKILLEHLN